MRSAVIVVALIAAPVTAQTKPPPEWVGQLGASYVANSGNANNSTIGSSGELVWQPGRFKSIVAGEFLRTKTDDRIGSKRIGASLRSEHTIPLRMSAYGKMAFYEDPPSGIRHQFSLAAGGLVHALTGERRSLALSLALTKTAERRVVAPDRNFIGSELGIELKVKPNHVVALEHSAAYIRDFSDGSNWRLRTTTSLTAALSRRLAFKCSHQLYRNKPDIGKRSTDQTMLASLVMRWPSR